MAGRVRTPPRSSTPARVAGGTLPRRQHALACCGPPPAIAVATLLRASPAQAAAAHEPARPIVDNQSKALRAELKFLKPRALRARAAADGVPAEVVDGADDADDVKAALVEMILEHAEVCRRRAAQQGAQERARLRLELSALRPRALRARAAELGVHDEVVDSADDADDVKEALIRIMLEHVPPRIRHESDACGPGPSAEDPRAAALRAELSGLRPRMLKSRARQEGISAEDIDACEDADDVKGALLELILVNSTQATSPPLAAAVHSGDQPPVASGVATGAEAASTVSVAEDEDEDEDEEALLRRDLAGLTLSALQRRATELTEDQQAIDGALDGASPKSELVALIIVSARRSAREMCAAREDPLLRSELARLGLAGLQRRAAAQGIEAPRIDAALDADAPKPALIQLLLLSAQPAARQPKHEPSTEAERRSSLQQQESAADTLAQQKVPAKVNRPHFGQHSAHADGAKALPHEPGGARNAIVTAPAGAAMTPDTHVMLSYQWDSQKTVASVYEFLTGLGQYPVWMDTQGGMASGDIYDDMAAGVSNASVVVCFMTQQYQSSENCMLEVKFAKQLGVEIVPVMLSAGWKATGWLGLLMAGRLWVAMHDPGAFERDVQSLHGQILNVIHSMEAQSELAGLGAAQEDSKEELERLREEVAVSQKAQSSAAVQVFSDPSQPATIPAGVPKLPARFHPTEQIHELIDIVLSTSREDMAKPRVGFFGMGGIGKTVTGAAITRDEAVRSHFHGIVWLPLGQNPVLGKLQNLCHMQCCGTDLPPDMSEEERKQSLQLAMAGKRILLCLDDLWEYSHELALNFADVSCGSKVLISTRVKGLLGRDAHQVNIILPSMQDSVQMLLAAADVTDETTAMREPAGVRDIASLCGRLPLALGIAGRLAASLGIGPAQDWRGMISLLKDELRQSHSGGTEEGMIRASLKTALPGSPEEQDNINKLLNLFALIPEDTPAPLEVLLLMFRAVHPSKTASILHLRKWLRVLIDRSLVLGTIDRPSLHDLVLDFCVAQHDRSSLQGAHQRVVEALRETRPKNAHNRCKFDRPPQDSMQAYVCAEIAWHLRGSGIFSDGAEMGHKQLLRAWLGDVPQDEIVLQTGQVLGVEKLCEAANRAEAANDWWLAGRLWSIACMIKAREEGSGATTFEVEKSLAALERVLKVLDRTSTGDAELNADVHEVLLQRLGSLMMLGDVESMQARTQLVDLVRTTDAAEQDPINATLLNFNVIFPTWFSAANLPDSERKVLSGEMFAAGLLDAVRFLAHAEKTCSDAGISYKCSLIKTFWIWFVDCFLVVEPALDWDALMGEGGSEIQAALDSYEYETGHRFLTETVNCDGLVFLGWLPLLLHYGNVEATLRAVEKFMPMIQRVIEEPDLTGEYLALTWCLPSLALFAKLFDFPAVMQSQIYACLQAAHLTWTEADERANQIGHPLIRRRGEKTKNHFACGVELTAWMVKCAYVLVAADLSVSPKEILASLPNVEDIINDDITCDTCMPTHMLTGSLNIWIHLGAVCEKLGAFEATVRYTTAALSTDLSKGGTLLPVARSLAHAMRGRAYAKLGQLSAAVPAFEAAADGARQCQLWFLEYKALSDLERCVPGQVSRGMENAGRLAEVVRRLHGPLEMLRSTMHQPNTADKRQGVPLANVDRAATRATLMGMRVMELQRRAVVAGVAEEQIENALDADDPKSELVILVLRAQATDATADRLRGELQALKWMALQQRALTDGVIEADVEDAMDSADPRQRLIALILARS